MKTRTLLAALATTTLVAGSANAASFTADFQTTIMSEQATGVGESGPYHVSVNENNPGYAAVGYRLANTNTDGTPFERDFTEAVQGWSFIGGGPNGVLTVSRESGGLVSWTTTDVTDPVTNTFDSFGQRQLQLWTTNDPGADLTAPTTTKNVEGSGYRSLANAEATIDISGLATGTVNFFYGAFSAKPIVSAVMKDTDGALADITIADFHLNGDTANRTEYYAAELGFNTDGGAYDTIVVSWVSGGTGNGRMGGTVITGTAVPEPGSLALLGLGGLLIARRRRG